MFIKLGYEIINNDNILFLLPICGLLIIDSCVFLLYIIQYQMSFLHATAIKGHSDICKLLLANGININQVDGVSIVFHYSCVTTVIYIGYIFCGREIRLVISCGKEQCLSEAEEIWKLHESTALS